MGVDNTKLALAHESYRIKVVEKIRLPTVQDRQQALEKAFYSMAYLNASDVYIDLITDSGSGSMSDTQWAAIMQADEAYIGSRSYQRFVASVSDVTGYPEIIPTHQGRAAENIIIEMLVRKGHYVLSNTFFETTRAHVQKREATPLDLVGEDLWEFNKNTPFKGNFDLEQLAVALERYHEHIPFLLITVVNNTACSSPVSMANIRAASALAKKYQKPVFFDACRFAENAYLIKQLEAGYEHKSIAEIVHEMFSYGDGCYMSAKKDALANIGGFIALKETDFAMRCRELLILNEGFPSYGGLSGRDLEAVAVGMYEGTDEDYLKDRIDQVDYLAQKLIKNAGIVVSQPTGSSGVFLDLQSIYPHLGEDKFPAVTLGCDTYLEGGIRLGAFPFILNGVDIHTGDIAPKNFGFARLAIPRRVYTNSHMDYVAEVMARVKEKAPHSKGYGITYAPDVLTHIFAKFAPLS